MSREYNPLFDGKIEVELLDTLTGEHSTTACGYSPHWWADGNGACDCNRRLIGFPAVESAAEEDPEDSPCGRSRFLVVAVHGDMAGYELWQFNSDHPRELLEVHLGAEQMRAMDAEIERRRTTVWVPGRD